MEAILKVTSSEFTDELFMKIKNILNSMNGAELTISISDNKTKGMLREETKEQYINRLNESIKNYDNGNVITFQGNTFDEFSKYILNEE